MLKVWDWMSGEQVAEVPVLDVVEPYIKVKAPKGRRGWDDGDGEQEHVREGREDGLFYLRWVVGAEEPRGFSIWRGACGEFVFGELLGGKRKERLDVR